MKIAVFKMNDYYNDYSEIDHIRKNYFGKELKKDGKYYTTRRFSAAFDCDKVLFKYRGMYIAQAEKCIDYKEDKNALKEDETAPKDDKNAPKSLNHYYQFNPDTIKLIPPIKEEIMEEYFVKITDNQNGVVLREVKKEDQKNIENILAFGDKNSILKSKWWQDCAKKLELANLLKEINLYNFENIHTAFFSNFIKENNIYNLKTKPFEYFLDLLKSKDPNFPNINIDSFEVLYQKVYTTDDKKHNIPDITIEINDTNKNKYRIIIECKITAEESVDKINGEEIRQCERYYNFFEKQNSNYKYFYVFLSMRKQNVDNYINVTFKEITNHIYYRNNYDKIKNEKILNSYLKSFHNLCDDKYRFGINEIPNIDRYDEQKLLELYENIKQDIEDIVKYEKANEIKNPELVNNYKYILVLIYNIKGLSKSEKETIEKCYKLLV